MAIAVTTDQILFDIRIWYHHLRMVRAHLEASAVAGLMPDELDYCIHVVDDLIGACEDAQAFISGEADALEASEEAGLGQGSDRSDGGSR